MNRIKYWLLCKLLGDICRKTDDCHNCRFNMDGMKKRGETVFGCAQAYAHGQARKAWGVDNENP